MAYREPARTAPRPVRIRKIRVAGLLVGTLAIAVVLVHQLPAFSPSTAVSPAAVPRSELSPSLGGAGALPEGATAFDSELPGIANLDPALLGALRRATTDAADDGVALHVDSGWRSPEYQEHLLEQAIAKYGSEAEAARWVATPETSPHVSGDAVDIGPADATAWLAEHGAEYGLCRIYGNEPWHYELRPEAVADGCPPTYADPTHDPRMRQRAESSDGLETSRPSSP